MGIQSGSERIRNQYFERLDSNEEIVLAARQLADQGIQCSYDVIMDNPLEDETDKRETLNLLLSLPRPFELHTHTLTHFPATNLTNLLLERGAIAAGDVEDIKQQSFERWTPSLDLARARDDMFWDSLYYLASRRSPGPGVIQWLSRRGWLRRHPKPLTLLLRLFSPYIQTERRGSRWDRKRRRLMERIGRAMKREKGTT